LFYAKGLGAASSLLGDDGKWSEARKMFDRVVADLLADRFVSDQEQLDAKNPVKPLSGRVPLGPRMIAIGGAALFAQLTGDKHYCNLGFELIEQILDQHVDNANDMWEWIDADHKPFMEDGRLRTDPGHAIECAGLSLKFLRTCEEQDLCDPAVVKRVPHLRSKLSQVLTRSFANGFSPVGYGIYKAVDLISRRPMNTDMPWWSLPEAMRAAIEAWRVASPQGKPALAEIARQCSNAFMRYYVRPDRYLNANQTLDEHGQPVARIPATPDVDPGYHTGLSLIDCLHCLAEASEKK
jgi:mannose/cellobiose epimerase-like protein (N-acyl-D-glucosamine 2-epimerase family)